MKEYEFVIVGSGIAGASLACELTGAGRRVLLVEQEDHPGYHATGRSAALYTELYGNACIRALTTASRSFFEVPPPGFAEHPLLTPRGCLYVATQSQLQILERIAHGAMTAAHPLARVSAAEMKASVPILREDLLAAGLYENGAMDIDVHALHQGYLRFAKAHGAEIAVGVGPARPCWRSGRWEVEFSGSVVTADTIVNAAGAWADAVAASAEIAPIGLMPLRRTALLVEPPVEGSARWPAVIDAAEQWYFKPDAGLLLLSPADEAPTEPCDVQPDHLDLAICIDRIEQVASLEVRRIKRSWAGLRTFAPDRTPVIGYAAEAPRFFWLAGQGGYGIQTAPAMSRVACALALGERLPDDVAEMGVDEAMLSPTRFATILREATNA
jgi:D-arginine dehydrogenase